MAGRGSPNGFGAGGYNLRNRPAVMPGRYPVERDDVTGTRQGSGNTQRLPPVINSPPAATNFWTLGGNDHPILYAGSVHGSQRTSKASHSSHLQKDQVEMDMEEKLLELEEAENSIQEETGVLKVEMESLRESIQRYEEYLQDVTSWSNSEEGNSRRQEIKKYQEMLDTKTEQMKVL